MSKKNDATILKMNSVLFLQRKRVMGFLYEALDILGKKMPRITIRIVEYNPNLEHEILGTSYTGKNFITISKQMVTWSDEKLRHCVWHELGHAWFDADHDSSSLMAPISPKTFDKQADILCLKRLENAQP